MITVISRFKVANGKAEEVNQAFLERPRLVESASGFRELDVLRDTNDSAIFYLYTKWDSLHSYQAWHSSPAHHASHKGIPKGLQLDPSFTQIEILRDHISAPRQMIAGFLEAFVSQSDQVFHFCLDRKGQIRSCSPSFLNVTNLSQADIRDRNIAEFLVASDAPVLAESLGACDEFRDLILNFVDSQLCPISVRARLCPANDGLLLIAERNMQEERELGRQLIELNNELTRLNRDIQQKSRQIAAARDQLATAIEERDKSYWFIRKLQEVLPFCMGCKKVKSSSSTWQNVDEFLTHNTDFLSHSYCPECLERWKSENL